MYIYLNFWPKLKFFFSKRNRWLDTSTYFFFHFAFPKTGEILINAKFAWLTIIFGKWIRSMVTQITQKRGEREPVCHFSIELFIC